MNRIYGAFHCKICGINVFYNVAMSKFLFIKDFIRQILRNVYPFDNSFHCLL